MGRVGTVIPYDLYNELVGHGQAAPLPLWVTKALAGDYEALGVYASISSVIEEADPDGDCVTFPKGWHDALLLPEGRLYRPMSRILKAGAITVKARYKKGGQIRLKREEFPPDIRRKLDSYRGPDGRLVMGFV